MIEVIPTIIAKNFQELQEKAKKVEPYVDWIQLDVMDGHFVDNLTWNKPADLINLKTSLKMEAHLMIQNPEKVIDDWINSEVKRIFIHYESTDQLEKIIGKIQRTGLEAGIAINPETPINVLEPFLNVSGFPEAGQARHETDKFQISNILVMTVEPGRGGQKLLEKTLVKIKNLREKYPGVNIEVDGGINLETASLAIQAGANILASGSAVFGSEDIKKTIQELRQR